MAPERPLAVLHRIVEILGSVFLATIPDDVAARTLPGLPEDTDYFDGMLWRLGIQPNRRSTLAVDDAGRLIVSGFTLGTSAWTFPSLVRWDGRRWGTLATNGVPIEVVLPPAGWFSPVPDPSFAEP